MDTAAYFDNDLVGLYFALRLTLPVLLSVGYLIVRTKLEDYGWRTNFRWPQAH